MRAAILEHAGKPLVIDHLTIAKPGPHEVLIRTVACGLCHSDLHFIDGTYPHPMPCVAGHEAAGIVEQVGSDVRMVKVGDHVVTCLSAFCGHCEYCVTGRMALCMGAETRRTPDQPPRLTRSSDGSLVNQMLNLSAFAEMMLIHEHACVAINRDMPLDRAAVIGCAVTTGAGTIFNACKLTPGETVVVVGCGGVGLATINAAKIAGAGRIIAADPIPEKRELALKLGATDVIDGWWARRYEQTTATGAAVDPITDKLFVASVVVTLVVLGKLAPIGVLLLATREIGELPLVLWLAASHAARKARVEQPLANLPGKMATLLQFAAVAAALFASPYTDGLLVATALVGTVAAASYWVREVKRFRADRAGRRDPG